MDTQEIIRQSIAVLDRCGWTQGVEYDDQTNAYCMFGAIRVVCSNNVPTRVIDVIEYRINGRSIAEWNDRPGRTRAQVVAMLQRTADAL